MFVCSSKPEVERSYVFPRRRHRRKKSWSLQYRRQMGLGGRELGLEPLICERKNGINHPHITIHFLKNEKGNSSHYVKVATKKSDGKGRSHPQGDSH